MFQCDRDEYIVEFTSPYKEDNDNILSRFEEERPYQYGRRYYFNRDRIKKYMLKKYLNVYKITCSNVKEMDISNIEKVRIKQKSYQNFMIIGILLMILLDMQVEMKLTGLFMI